MKRIRFVHKIIAILFKDRMQYSGKLLADTASLIARCGVLLLLYAYVFNLRGGEVNNISFDVVAWSILFYFIFVTLGLRNIFRAIMQDVQSGTIEVLFSKPISYIAYKMWWQIASGAYSFFVALMLGTVTLIIFVGIPETMTVRIFIPTLIVTFFGAVILSLVLYVIVGLLAFWIEDVSPVYWIVDKAVMILGGSYLPVALFPDFMYRLAIYSPFGASQFITHTVYESWQHNWHILIGIQMFWLVVLTVIMISLFQRARLRVSINGG